MLEALGVIWFFIRLSLMQYSVISTYLLIPLLIGIIGIFVGLFDLIFDFSNSKNEKKKNKKLNFYKVIEIISIIVNVLNFISVIILSLFPINFFSFTSSDDVYFFTNGGEFTIVVLIIELVSLIMFFVSSKFKEYKFTLRRISFICLSIVNIITWVMMISNLSSNM